MKEKKEKKEKKKEKKEKKEEEHNTPALGWVGTCNMPVNEVHL